MVCDFQFFFSHTNRWRLWNWSDLVKLLRNSTVIDSDWSVAAKTKSQVQGCYRDTHTCTLKCQHTNTILSLTVTHDCLLTQTNMHAQVKNTLWEIVQIGIVADLTNSMWFHGSCLFWLLELTQYTFWQSTSPTQLHNNSQVFWLAACFVFIVHWRKTKNRQNLPEHGRLWFVIGNDLLRVRRGQTCQSSLVVNCQWKGVSMLQIKCLLDGLKHLPLKTFLMLGYWERCIQQFL